VTLIPCVHSSDLIAVIDTGSPISLIKDFLVPSLHCKPYQQTTSYTGINSSELRILGEFECKILLNNFETSILFHVVPSDTMTHNLVLGRNFLFTPDLQIIFDRERGIVVNKVEPGPIQESSFQPENELLLIDPHALRDGIDHIIINPEVDKQVDCKLNFLLQQHFQEEEPTVPQTQLEATIIMKPDHVPFNFNARRLSVFEKSQLREILDNLLREGVIRESNSPYASPIVLVKKKTGDLRLCIDFRTLNKQVVKDRYPLPFIDDQIDKLRGKKYFTKLDLKNAFYHLKLSPDSTKYTSFVTPFGQFEYQRLPFGFCNSPSIFMRYLNTIFRDLIDASKICVFLDDILIPSETVEDNLTILDIVLKRLKQNKLRLRTDKCHFLMTTINYLGYTVSSEGISPCQEHIDSVFRFPTPRNTREVQSFLGLVSYFRRFIQNFSYIAQPLCNLTKKSVNFRFGEKELEAFELLKNMLASQPVLAIYSPTVDTELHCDASSLGFGAVLLQRQEDDKFHPISYFSKRTNDAESRYHSFELECLAIIYALKRFHVYLQGIHFKIITDCNSLKLTLDRKDLNPRISRWALWLQNYDYKLEHRASSRMKHVDALSRQPVMILEATSFKQNLSLAQLQDSGISKLREFLEQQEHNKYELRDGLVYYKFKDRLLFYVPQLMEQQILCMYHDNFGHVGPDKVIELITRLYWFPKLRQKVHDYVSNCLKCITFSPISKKQGLLHNIPKDDVPFSTIHIDHFGPLPKTQQRFQYIFEVIDAFSKFIKLYPCRSTDAKEVTKHLSHYFQDYSRPLRIISDRGSAFRSDAFKEFVSENNVQHVLIATGTPQANG
jgi:hypothetical protein